MLLIDSLRDEEGVWLNRPLNFSFHNKELRFTTERDTDFWQQTYYGFQHHSGHAFGFHVDSDFTLQVKVTADFSHLYDQAGIFIMDDQKNWVKAGMEFNDDQPSIGCVITRDVSDWSTGIFPGDPKVFWMRATLENKALRIQYSSDGKVWPLLRLCYWPDNRKRFVGVAGCTPQRKGLEVNFSEFTVTPPLRKNLHDLT